MAVTSACRTSHEINEANEENGRYNNIYMLPFSHSPLVISPFHLQLQWLQ